MIFTLYGCKLWTLGHHRAYSMSSFQAGSVGFDFSKAKIARHGGLSMEIKLTDNPSFKNCLLLLNRMFGYWNGLNILTGGVQTSCSSAVATCYRLLPSELSLKNRTVLPNYIKRWRHTLTKIKTRWGRTFPDFCQPQFPGSFAFNTIYQLTISCCLVKTKTSVLLISHWFD